MWVPHTQGLHARQAAYQCRSFHPLPAPCVVGTGRQNSLAAADTRGCSLPSETDTHGTLQTHGHRHRHTHTRTRTRTHTHTHSQSSMGKGVRLTLYTRTSLADGGENGDVMVCVGAQVVEIRGLAMLRNQAHKLALFVLIDQRKGILAPSCHRFHRLRTEQFYWFCSLKVVVGDALATLKGYN